MIENMKVGIEVMDKESRLVLGAADRRVIMRKPGYYFGHYGRSAIGALIYDVIDKLGHKIKEANGVWAVFYCSDDALLHELEKMVEEFEGWTSQKASLVISCEKDPQIAEGMVEYEILLSGIRKIE